MLAYIVRRIGYGFLTVLGVVIGVASVVIMVSLGQGATESVTSQVESLGSNLVMAIPGQGVGRGGGSALRGDQHHLHHAFLRAGFSTGQAWFGIMAFAIALAGIALIGLPPSGAFLGKWQLLAGAVATGQWLWLVITVIGIRMLKILPVSLADEVTDTHAAA